MSTVNWWDSVASLTPIAAWDAARVDGNMLTDGVGDNHITASKDLVVNKDKSVGVSGDGQKMMFNTGIPIPEVGVVAGWWSPLTPTRILGNSPHITYGTAYQPRAFKSPIHGVGNGWSEANFGTYGDATSPVFAVMVTRGTDVIYYVNGEQLGGALDRETYANWTVASIGDHFGYDENLAAGEYLHALAFFSGSVSHEGVLVLEAAARAALAPPSTESIPPSGAFGFAISNDYGKVLVSSETQNLHFIGKAALSEVLVTSSDCGGMYRWIYSFSCIDYPTPFLTDNGGFTAVTSVRLGGAGWQIEIISTKPDFVEVYIFAPARSATFTGTHGVRVMRRDGKVSFDSRGKPLSVMASEMVRPPSSVRYGAISGTPWFCRSMPNSTLAPNATSMHYPSYQVSRSIGKAIYHYGSIAQAQIEREFTTGRWGEGGWFDKREYQLWSTYWGFYRAGVKLQKFSDSFYGAECGWVPVDSGCYAVRYESGRSMAGFNVGGGGTSSGGTWPFQNETINLQPTLLLISDGLLYDEIGEIPVVYDDPRFQQGGGHGSWETMTGTPFYVHCTGGDPPASFFDSPEAAFSDFLNKENAAAVKRWDDAQASWPAGCPHTAVDKYVYTKIETTSGTHASGLYEFVSDAVAQDKLPDGTLGDKYILTTSVNRTLDISGSQIDFSIPAPLAGAPNIIQATALAALAAHCADRWAMGGCTDLWGLLVVPAYDVANVNAVPEYGKYFGSYKIRIGGLESLVQCLPINGIFPMNMVFPPEMTAPP